MHENAGDRLNLYLDGLGKQLSTENLHVATDFSLYIHESWAEHARSFPPSARSEDGDDTVAAAA